jgi:cytochrome P450
MEAPPDPRDTYDRLRAACPVAASPRGVMLLRHADVVAAAMDPETFSSGASARRQVPNSLDPPEHTTFRTFIDRFFTPERMALLEPKLDACARAIVDALPRHSVIDVVTGFGYAFAVRAQTEWLGWHGTEDALLAWMAENHAATRSGDRGRMASVAAAFDEIVAAQICRRRGSAAPDAPVDPTSELLQVRVDGAPLQDADVVSILRNWTAGDLGSIAASLGVVVYFLATHQDVQAALRRDESELVAAIDEMLRIDDPFLVNRRVVTRNVRIGRLDLEAGTVVDLNWTSANRDADVFGDPDAFRPREHAAGNLVYGTGIHVCPGRPLATLELVVATRTLLRRTMKIELAADVPAERETYPVGGWRRVPIVLR